MKKSLLGLVLTLALLLCGAQAEEAASYVPGSIAQALLAEAFDSGRIVCVDASVDLAANARLFSEDDAGLAEAGMEAINNAQLSLGVGKLEDGLLLTLGAQYAAEGAQPVDAQVLVGLTKDGLWLETSLLPGERVSARWETVLAMLGLDEASISQIMALRDMEPEVLMQQLLAQADALLTVAAQVAVPYQQIVYDFVAGLPTNVSTDVEEQGYFPAAKTEVAFAATDKALGGLFTALADQLEQDETLRPLVDMLLAQADMTDEDGSALTTAALCAQVRAAAAEMTDEENPMVLFFGYDEAENLLYVSGCSPLDDGGVLVINLVDIAAQEPGTGYLLQGYVSESAEDEDAPFSGLTASFYCEGDPEDKTVGLFSGMLELDADSATILSMAMDVDVSPITTADNLPGYASAVSMSLSMTDGTSDISMVTIAEGENGMTPDGGEYAKSEGKTDTYIDGTSETSTVSVSSRFAPGEEGPTGEWLETMSMPASGIDSIACAYRLYTLAPYAPAENLTVLALETASAEDMDALMMRLMTSAEAPLTALSEQLPPAILALGEAAE